MKIPAVTSSGLGYQYLPPPGRDLLQAGQLAGSVLPEAGGVGGKRKAPAPYFVGWFILVCSSRTAFPPSTRSRASRPSCVS